MGFCSREGKFRRGEVRDGGEVVADKLITIEWHCCYIETRQMHAFISYSSKDKAAVEKLVLGLHQRGIDPWWDKWEIGPGDDIVASINAGLDEAGAGIIVFSQHSRESRWVEAEVSYLTYARIQESKLLIPVVLGDDAWVPPLLRPLARRGIDEIDAIADALLHRRPGPPPRRAPEHGRVERVLISLNREPAGKIRVSVRAGDQEYGNSAYSELPRRLVEAQASFLRGFRTVLHRSAVDAERASLEGGVAELGRALRAFCLPGDSGDALANLADGCKVGVTLEVCFEAYDPVLLALPFEALRLPDDRLLATHPTVVMMRRPTGGEDVTGTPLAGPLKILVAVGAPDEGQSGGDGAGSGTRAAEHPRRGSARPAARECRSTHPRGGTSRGDRSRHRVRRLSRAAPLLPWPAGRARTGRRGRRRGSHHGGGTDRADSPHRPAVADGPSQLLSRWRA